MARTQQKPASPQHAEVIHLLETVEQSLLSQDFDTYANLISLPLVVTTRKARFVYTERAHLHRNFTTWQRTIRTLKATRLEQRLQSVAQIGTKGLIVDYDTLVLSGKRNVLPRFKNLMFLNQTRHGLRIEQIVQRRVRSSSGQPDLGGARGGNAADRSETGTGRPRKCLKSTFLTCR